MAVNQKAVITIKLAQHQVRQAAMVQAGISPAQWAVKHGTRVARDRRHAARTGQMKHKGHAYD